MSEQQLTPKFVDVDGRPVPDIRYAYGRQAYNTRGQHPECQPRIAPDLLARKRREFFEGLYPKRLKDSPEEKSEGET